MGSDIPLQSSNLLVDGTHLEPQARQIWLEAGRVGPGRTEIHALCVEQGGLDGSHVHNSVNRTGSSIITRDTGIEDQLELLQERNERGFLRGGQQTVRVYVYGLNRGRRRNSLRDGSAPWDEEDSIGDSRTVRRAWHRWSF